ncbi:MAG: family 16 glycosylhydrolase [Fibrobacterales bacterium]
MIVILVQHTFKLMYKLFKTITTFITGVILLIGIAGCLGDSATGTAEVEESSAEGVSLISSIQESIVDESSLEQSSSSSSLVSPPYSRETPVESSSSSTPIEIIQSSSEKIISSSSEVSSSAVFESSSSQEPSSSERVIDICQMKGLTPYEDVNDDPNMGDYNIWGGELFSHQKFNSGKFEVRVMAPGIPGTVSSMFLYKQGSEKSEEFWHEVDVEFLGSRPGSFQSNLLTGFSPLDHAEEHHELYPAPVEGFHVYAIEWTSDYIAWSVDGEEVRRDTKDDGSQMHHFNNTEMSLHFNHWPVANTEQLHEWAGHFKTDALPAAAIYDWIKYSKWTPGAGDEGSDFSHEWTDDLNGFDGGRWKTASWSFAENRSTFNGNNVKFINGYMVLALTWGQKGYEPDECFPKE